MDLFNNDILVNLLPFDGVVLYYGKVMSQTKALDYFSALLQFIEWRNDEAVIFGRHIVTKRKIAWYADENYSYSYSNTTKQALPWTKELLELKQLTEKLTGSKYNSCLLNLYHNGEEGMAWHSDAETTLEKNGSIASLSFGAERKFSFKHKKTGQVLSLVLEHGSLMVMKDTTQTNWLHRLPQSKKIATPRINLTFRIIKKV
jgi:alkylated DNA repair dioxygenase AlkB